MSSEPSNVAITFSGAVANGAFEAGALAVLSEEDLPITRVLGTSSGALNATLFARYLLAGDPRAGAKELVALWRTEASIWHVIRPSWRGIRTFTGLSGQSGIVEILRRHVAPVPEARADVDLFLVVTALDGRLGDIGGSAATTHEGVCHFRGDDFATPERLERVFQAAAASAAFPGVFAPANVPGLGPCSDGGIVNNTPLAHVLDADVGRVVVLVPSPRVSHDQPPRNPGALLGRIADVIVQERLYRDLRAAEKVNARIAALDDLAVKGNDRSLLYDARIAAGLGGKRRVRILEVRPDRALPNPFSGFFSRKSREDLLERGREAAQRALRLDGWLDPAATSAPRAPARLAGAS